MNIDPSTIVHFFCVAPQTWVDEQKRTGHHKELQGFVNSTQFWKVRLGIEPNLNELLLGGCPEGEEIDLSVPLRDWGILKHSDSKSSISTELSVYFAVTTFKNLPGGNKLVVIGLAYHDEESRIDEADSDDLATYLPKDKAPAKRPAANGIVYYSFPKVERGHSQAKILASMDQFLKRYPQLSAAIFDSDDIGVVVVQKQSFSMGTGGYLEKQEVSHFKEDLPKWQPGGVVLDNYALGRNGRGIDQLVVYWGPKSADAILALIPTATRL
jgi:hypothetical protein